MLPEVSSTLASPLPAKQYRASINGCAEGPLSGEKQIPSVQLGGMHRMSGIHAAPSFSLPFFGRIRSCAQQAGPGSAALPAQRR